MPVPWNTDFTTLSGSEWASISRDPAFAAMFAAAMSERLAARSGLSSSSDPFALPEAGDNALTFWHTLRQRVFELRGSFVRQITPFAGAVSIDSWRCSATPEPTFPFTNTTFTPFAFPPDGVERRWPREIWALSCDGEEGQIARFTARRGARWLGVPTTDPLFNTRQTTPEAEYEHTTQFFTHDGEAWLPAAADVHDADVLTETRRVERIFEGTDVLPDYSGDYFGPEYLNDVRDMINLLVWTCRAVHLVTFNSFGVLSSAWNHTALLPSGGIGYTLGADGLYSILTATDNNPGGFTRGVELWWKPGVIDDPARVWTLLNDFGPTASNTPFSHDISPAFASPWRTGSSVDFFGPPAAIVQKWDVPGGFQYTVATE